MSQEPPKIRKLDETVVNRIAAGEIIQRPANALKEMIENSLDAKSTNIQIIVKNGGLKLLQIQDNGVGIRKDDLSIVCERFTTSKLREFEDLSTIATFGFRGEALASISHVSHLRIVSKTASEKCAYTAPYEDGKLKSDPVPVAATQGTQITIEDLFYNMNVRRRALRSPAEEYQKIFDVVSKYAVHNSKVGFGLKKHGENNDIKTPPDSSNIDNIKMIFGNQIAKELIEFNLENDTYKFRIHGYITNPNYSTKKFVFLLFINHRLVECQSLKKCLDQVYATYLPKNTHPFVYLSLELDPRCVDVNVHPTKHEVHFFNEEQIVELVMTAVESKLLGSNNSRVFYTQTKLPGVIPETAIVSNKATDSNKTIQPKDYVRTDSAEQKITKFFGAPTASKAEDHDQSVSEHDFDKYNKGFLKRTEQLEDDVLERAPKEKAGLEKRQSSAKSPKLTQCKSALSQMTRIETKLSSILELRNEIEHDVHRNLRELFSQHVFVGSIDSERSLIQYSTKLYLCNTRRIMREVFYQLIIYNFQNIPVIKLSQPLSIYELALMALELQEVGWTPEDGEKSELAQRIVEILTEKGDMLNEYFSVEVDEYGKIKSLPLVLDDYLPDMAGLPAYVLRLASEVNWETEKDCFQSFAVETASYYARLYDERVNESSNWKWVTEHVWYPAIKKYFLPPRSFTENASVLQIADLPALYKVFERC